MGTQSPVLSELSSDSNSRHESEEELEEYDVETIRGWRYNRQEQCKEFLIKWRGFSEEENTWEPESHLNCPEPMSAFLRTRTKRELAYLNAKNPDYLTGLQRNAEIKSIASDASEFYLKARTNPNKRKRSRTNDCKFVLMIVFEDGEKQAEEVSMDDLFKHRPDKMFEWIEQRLVSEEALLYRRDVLPDNRLQVDRDRR